MRSPRPTWPITLLLAVAVGSGQARGQEKSWVSVGIGGGGGIFVPASSPHDPNLMFCASDMSGAYRSTDGGRTWRMLNWRQISSAIVCPAVFHPTDPNVMYWISGPWAGPVLRVSRDKGLTWKPVTDQMPWRHGTPQSTLVGLGPRGEVLLVSADNGTFRSDDQGKTWTRAAGIEKRVIAFFFEPPKLGNFWYAATPGGVLCSADRGRTWAPCPGKSPGRPIGAFCGGADETTGEVVLYCAVPSQEDKGRFSGGIFRSDDRGSTWKSAMGSGLNTTIGRHGPVRSTIAQYVRLGMASNQTDTAYAYCYGTGTRVPYSSTVYRTDDRGGTWRRVLIGPRHARGQNVDLAWINYERGWSGGVISFSVNARHKDVVAFSSAMELFVTLNGGKRWRQAYTRCVDDKPDAGKRWAGVGLEMTTTWHFKFDPHQRNRVYICYTDIGFARSLDRGKSWQYSPTGSPWSNTFYDIEFDPQKPGVIYAACAYQHDIPSWKVAGTVAGGGGVCVSKDWGKTWFAKAKGTPAKGACTAVELDPRSPPQSRTLYATIYGGGVFKSTDGAKTWRARNDGLNVKSNNHFTDIRLHRDGTLLAMCGAKKRGRNTPVAMGGLFKSTDGGATWTDLIADLKLYHPYGFEVHPSDSSTIYVCACAVPGHHDQDGVYKSTDGGRTWKKLSMDWPPGGPSYGHPKFPSIDPYNPNRVWVSTGTRGLMVTTDAGATWKEVKGVPFRGVNRVTVDPEDHETIWCSSFGGGIWRGPATEAD